MACVLDASAPCGSTAGAAPAEGAPAKHAPEVLGYRFDALGCSGRIRLAGVAQARAEAFVVDALGWLRDLERRLTRFRDDSLIGRLNQLAGRGAVAVDADGLAVIAAAERAWQLSAGRLDATILPLWRLWHAPERSSWPQQEELERARALVGWCKLHRRSGTLSLALPGMALDLGGVGKEWAVDQLVARATAAGRGDCLVELGGDCRARGRQGDPAGWWVALPGARAALLLADEALATSGHGTRRRQLNGRSVSHLIDALSGMPGGGGVQSATILAPSCLDAGIRASDCCLLEAAAPAALAARSGGWPSWCWGADSRLYADPRLLARIHPLAPAQRAV